MNPNPKIKKIKELSYAQQEGSAKPIHTQQSKSNATKKNTITVITHHTHTKSRNTNSKPNAKLTMKKAYTRRSVFPPELTSRKREREESNLTENVWNSEYASSTERERERCLVKTKTVAQISSRSRSQLLCWVRRPSLMGMTKTYICIYKCLLFFWTHILFPFQLIYLGPLCGHTRPQIFAFWTFKAFTIF